MQARAGINQQGRIIIPAECRAAAGLKPGDELLIEAIGAGELACAPRSKQSRKRRPL